MKNHKMKLRILVLSGIREVFEPIDAIFTKEEVNDIFQDFELCITFKLVNNKVNNKESNYDLIFWPELKKLMNSFVNKTNVIKQELTHDNRYDIVLFGPVIERNLPEDYHSYELQFDKLKRENVNILFVSLSSPKCKDEENLYNKYGVKVIGELNWGKFEENLIKFLKEGKLNFYKKELVNSNNI